MAHVADGYSGHDIITNALCAEAYYQGQQYFAATHQAICPANPPCHHEHIVDFEQGLTHAYDADPSRNTPHDSISQGGPEYEYDPPEEPPFTDEFSDELKHHLPHHHEEFGTEYEPEADPGEPIVY